MRPINFLLASIIAFSLVLFVAIDKNELTDYQSFIVVVVDIIIFFLALISFVLDDIYKELKNKQK